MIHRQAVKTAALHAAGTGHCGHSSTAERQIVDLLIGVRSPVVTPRSHSRAVRQRHLTA